MPTYEATPRFTSDLDRLTPEQLRRFRQAINAFVDDIGTGRFRAGLREVREFAESGTAQAPNWRVIRARSHLDARVGSPEQGLAMTHRM